MDKRELTRTLKSLGLKLDGVPRFRDCYVEDGKIVIRTRTGGEVNRRIYAAENERLRQGKGFIKDEDAEDNFTFALFYYKTA